MVIGVATIRLILPEMASIKDKRRVVKSIAERTRARFNVAVAEVDDLDSWTAITLGIACVSNNGAHAHEMLEKAVSSIADARLDAELADYAITLY